MITASEAITLVGQSSGWTMDSASAVVEALLKSGKWSAEAIYLGFRSGFKCEYCGCDLLKSADSYKLWERDHLIPISQGGPEDNLDNLALACTLCNVKYKNRWDPSRHSPAKDRQSLIAATKAYVAERRLETERELSEVRRLVRYKEQ